MLIVEGYFELLWNADSIRVGQIRFCSGRLRVRENLVGGQWMGRTPAGQYQKVTILLEGPASRTMPTLTYERLNDTWIERAERLIWGWFFAMADERRKRHTAGGGPWSESTYEASHAASTWRQAPKPLVCPLLMMIPSREDWIEVGGWGNKPECGFQ